MNGDKVKNATWPMIIVIIYVCCVYVLTSIIEVRNWQAIMLFTLAEVFTFYVIASATFNINKRRAMCLVLSIQIFAFSIPYMLSSWLYVNTSFATPFNTLFELFYPFGTATSLMLLIASIIPTGLLNDVSSHFRIDHYLHRFNMRVGLYIFSTEEASR